MKLRINKVLDLIDYIEQHLIAWLLRINKTATSLKFYIPILSLINRLTQHTNTKVLEHSGLKWRFRWGEADSIWWI